MPRNDNQLPETPLLPVPFPPEATPAWFDHLLDECDAELQRVQLVVNVIRANLVIEAEALPAGFDPDAVLPVWHEQRILPLITTGMFADAWEDTMLRYVAVLSATQELFTHWRPAAERMESFANRHIHLYEELRDVVGIVLYDERDRRNAMKL